ncbi:protein MHF1 homolog isoform X2 [Vicia villosa]|uniref:protein MHF1 homolog isoform X2 n=1 Tax=Vicia villosa TaxID=3911 RepID=UPI00273C567C|nr:protein MHF1 homolog isoform X2 [Vicia villosa]
MATEGVGGSGSSSEVENDLEMKLLRDRFRLSAISIAESQASKSGMEVSNVVVACVADLAFKYTERLAKDLQLFSQHANRKSVNIEDVILSVCVLVQRIEMNIYLAC